MILIDTNLLIYAINRDAPQHAMACHWLEQTLSETTPVGLPWLVTLAFIRVTTHPRILANPMSPEQALAIVDSWLAQPFVAAVEPGERHWGILNRLLQQSGSAGNLTNDAHLAALAIEHGYTLYSADNDFKRFEGLQHVNPLAAGEVHEPDSAYSR